MKQQLIGIKFFATDFILHAWASQTATYEYFGTYPAYELLAYVRGGLLCAKNANPRVTEFSLTLGLAVFFDFSIFSGHTSWHEDPQEYPNLYILQYWSARSWIALWHTIQVDIVNMRGLFFVFYHLIRAHSCTYWSHLAVIYVALLANMIQVPTKVKIGLLHL